MLEMGFHSVRLQTSSVCHRAWSPDYDPDFSRQGGIPGALGKVVGFVQLTHRAAMYRLCTDFGTPKSPKRQIAIATRIQSEFQIATGRRLSDQTIRNQLHEDGMNARHPAIGPILTPDHYMRRLKFTQEPRDWRMHE